MYGNFTTSRPTKRDDLLGKWFMVIVDGYGEALPSWRLFRADSTCEESGALQVRDPQLQERSWFDIADLLDDERCTIIPDELAYRIGSMLNFYAWARAGQCMKQLAEDCDADGIAELIQERVKCLE